jgi:hypothetical protein
MAGGTKSSSTQKSQSTQASGSGQTWAQPYAQDAVKAITDNFKANQPALQANVDKANAFGDQLMGGWNTAKAGSATAGGVANKGVGYTSDVLGGKYLNGNPYLQAMIDQSRGDIADTTNSQFSLAGRYGSGAHTDVLANAIADMEAQMRFNNYTAERGYMNDAASLRSGEQQQAAARAQQAEQAAAQLAMQQQAQAAQLPYTGSNNLANALGALFSGGTGSSTASGTSTSKTSNGILGPVGTIAGGLAAGGYF